MSEACVVVHAAGQAAAALRLAAGQRVALLSAAGAGGFLGAAGWRALVAEAARLAPGTPFADLLCCGDAPGHALAALRAGCRIVVLHGACAGYPAVAAAAAECGARLLPARPAALDLAGLDFRREGARRRLAQWLAAAPDDSAAAGG